MRATPASSSTPASTERCTDFGGVRIRYDDRVLRPRLWTTAQSTWAGELLRTGPPGRLLELCAGVGHIGLLTAVVRAADAVLVDVDPVACAFARENVEEAGLTHRVQVRRRRVTDVPDEDELFSVVIADPPWVPSGETDRFPLDPLLAIDGGSDGLDLARECVWAVDRCLHPRGSAVVQLGTAEQARLLEAWLGGSDGPDLETVETRTFGDRGVLIHLQRPG